MPLLQQQQQQQLAVQDTYYSSRAEAMQNVESTIHELGGIFQQLSHIVRLQLLIAAFCGSLFTAPMPRLGLPCHVCHQLSICRTYREDALG